MISVSPLLFPLLINLSLPCYLSSFVNIFQVSAFLVTPSTLSSCDLILPLRLFSNLYFFFSSTSFPHAFRPQFHFMLLITTSHSLTKPFSSLVHFCSLTSSSSLLCFPSSLAFVNLTCRPHVFNLHVTNCLNDKEASPISENPFPVINPHCGRPSGEPY